MYFPLMDLEGVDEVDVLVARLPLALRFAALLMGRSLLGERSVKLPLPDVAPIALSPSLLL